MKWYRCQECGCYLDPGEGGLCEDCQAARRRKAQAEARVRMEHTGQYYMHLFSEDVKVS